MGFLTCLREFDFRCFGAFLPVDAISDQEEEDVEEVEEDKDGRSGTVFFQNG